MSSQILDMPELLERCEALDSPEAYRALLSELETRVASVDPSQIRRSLDDSNKRLQVAAAFCLTARLGDGQDLYRELLLGTDTFTEPALGRDGRYWLIHFLGLSGDGRYAAVLEGILRHHYHHHPPRHTARALARLGVDVDSLEVPFDRSITASQRGSRILIHDDERFSGSSNCIHCRFFPCRINHYHQGAIEDCKLWNRTDPETLFEIVDYRKEHPEPAAASEQSPSAAEQLEELLKQADEYEGSGKLEAAAQTLRQAVLLTGDVNRKVAYLSRASRYLVTGGNRQGAYSLLKLIEDKVAEANDEKVVRRWESTFLTLREELGGYVGTGSYEARTPAGRILADLFARLRRGPGSDRAEIRALISFLDGTLEQSEDTWNCYRWLSSVSSLCLAIGEPERAQRPIDRVSRRPGKSEPEALEDAVLLARQLGYLGDPTAGCTRFAELLPRIRRLQDPDRRLEYLGYVLEALSRRRPAPVIADVEGLIDETGLLLEELLLLQPGSASRRRLREKHQRTLESSLTALQAVAEAGPEADAQAAMARAWRLILASRNPELRNPATAIPERQRGRLGSLEDSLHRGLHHYLCSQGRYSRDSFVVESVRKVVDFELSAVERRQQPGGSSDQPPAGGLGLAFFQFQELFPDRPWLLLSHLEGTYTRHWLRAAGKRIFEPLERWWQRIERLGRQRREVGSLRAARGMARRDLEPVGRRDPETEDAPDDQEARGLVSKLLPPSLTGSGSASGDDAVLEPASRRWYVFPEGRLHSLPVELLPDPGTGDPLGRHLAVRFCLRPTPTRPPDEGIDFVRGWLGLGAAPDACHFGELPGTRDELESIAALLRARGFEAETLLGEDAHAGNLLARLEAEPPAVLHLAVHGHADAELPDACALVLAVEPASVAVELLPFRLIRELPLRNVQLVVLSACSSLVGRSDAGVGMEGLAWAFLEAGAAQVLASRYPVADRETCELMRRFYTHLLEQPADEALRRTRVEALADLGISRREVGAWALWS